MPAQTPTNVGTAYYSHNDTGPPLRRRLEEGDGSPMDLTNADTVTIIISFARYSHYYSPYRPIVNRGPCQIEDPRSDGWVFWVPQSGDLSPPGEFHFVFEVTWNDGTTQTVPAHTYETLVIRTKPGGFDI